MNTRPVPASRRGAQAHAVHLDVVGVPVATVLVVGGEDVGALVVEDGGQTCGRLIDVGPPEAGRIVVGGFAGHARVAVPEILVTAHPEDLARRSELDSASLGQGLSGGENPVGHLAQFTAGGSDEHDTVPFGRHPGHRPPGLDGLIVGMGMEEHCGGHDVAG